MEFLVAKVKDNSNYSSSKDGTFKAEAVIDNQLVEVDVTYTSPYYRVNSGGFIAIPEKETQILILHNKNPKNKGESLFYFHSCIVTDKGSTDDPKRNKEFEAIKDNDKKAKIYSKLDKPVTQAFTNAVGAGVYIQRDFDGISIKNNVILKAENDCEVTCGAPGIQITNNHGDNITLTSDTIIDGPPAAPVGARSLSIVTRGNQEYKCTNSDITMKIVDGGDINIENNSTGAFGMLMKAASFIAPVRPPTAFAAGLTPQSGNIRLKSRWRDIILAALGVGSKIHIVTNTSKIVVDGQTGQINIFSPGGVDINSVGPINMNSVANINLNSSGAITMNAPAITSNASNHFINGERIQTINPRGVQQDPVPIINTPVGPPVSPPTNLADDYNDGFPGAGAT